MKVTHSELVNLLLFVLSFIDETFNTPFTLVISVPFDSSFHNEPQVLMNQILRIWKVLPKIGFYDVEITKSS
jgi:hypothetical protein